MFASAAKNRDAIELRLMVPRTVIEERTQVVEENGRRALKVYRVQKAVFEERIITVDDEVEFYDCAGKPIEAKLIPKRLEKSTAVPISFDQIADQKYLEAFREDITVIVFTGEKAKAMMPRVPQ
jgi:hypothetical protein